jgi:RimJ/RimL family protein N-acetyltransferase
MIQLKNADVVLRRFRVEDAEAMALLANNRKLSINMRDGFHYPYTLEHARAFIQRFIEQDPLSVFAIEYKGIYVGNISLMKANDVYRKSAEIGYFIGEPYWNKGIATKAVQLICEYGFKNLDIVRIHSGIFKFNTASQRVLEKSGFEKEGIFKQSIYKDNKIWDEIRYAKILKK